MLPSFVVSRATLKVSNILCLLNVFRRLNAVCVLWGAVENALNCLTLLNKRKIRCILDCILKIQKWDLPVQYSLIKCKQDRNMKTKVVTHPREFSINDSLQTKLYSLLSVHSITAHFLVIFIQVENEVLRKLLLFWFIIKLILYFHVVAFSVAFLHLLQSYTSSM